MELHPIKTEQDYDTALRTIEALWTASSSRINASEKPSTSMVRAIERRLSGTERTSLHGRSRPCTFPG